MAIMMGYIPSEHQLALSAFGEAIYLVAAHHLSKGLDRSRLLGAIRYHGDIDGIRVKAWAQHELCLDDDRPFGYGWAIYLDDRQYMASERGEHETLLDAEQELLASIPESLEIYRHSKGVEK